MGHSNVDQLSKIQDRIKSFLLDKDYRRENYKRDVMLYRSLDFIYNKLNASPHAAKFEEEQSIKSPHIQSKTKQKKDAEEIGKVINEMLMQEEMDWEEFREQVAIQNELKNEIMESDIEERWVEEKNRLMNMNDQQLMVDKHRIENEVREANERKAKEDVERLKDEKDRLVKLIEQLNLSIARRYENIERLEAENANRKVRIGELEASLSIRYEELNKNIVLMFGDEAHHIQKLFKDYIEGHLELDEMLHKVHVLSDKLKDKPAEHVDFKDNVSAVKEMRKDNVELGETKAAYKHAEIVIVKEKREVKKEEVHLDNAVEQKKAINKAEGEKNKTAALNDHDKKDDANVSGEVNLVEMKEALDSERKQIDSPDLNYDTDDIGLSFDDDVSDENNNIAYVAQNRETEKYHHQRLDSDSSTALIMDEFNMVDKRDEVVDSVLPKQIKEEKSVKTSSFERPQSGITLQKKFETSTANLQQSADSKNHFKK